MANGVERGSAVRRTCTPEPARPRAIEFGYPASQYLVRQPLFWETRGMVTTPATLSPAFSPFARNWPEAAISRPYAFCLFGRFEARRAGTDWMQLEGRKMQEIMSYLLLFRQRPHQREVLAGTLWGTSSRPRARKNLRQSLWLLQERSGLDGTDLDIPLLLVGKEWVQVNQEAVWLDVARFEEAYESVRTVAGEQLTNARADDVAGAAELYRGDLLEGWQEEWCIFERERLRVIYLAMLQKLLGYCEATGRFEEGLTHGARLLRHDRAHERAHWRMMRLSYLAGDRTGALRQFDKCRAALQEELGVGPGLLTRSLYEQICADTGGMLTPAGPAAAS